MSILIKGMEMPKEGEYRMTLYVCSDGQAYVDVELFPVDEDKFDAVPVPPHGRLIDADALEYHADNVRDTMGRTEKTVMWNKIQSAPTIIEAEVGK